MIPGHVPYTAVHLHSGLLESCSSKDMQIHSPVDPWPLLGPTGYPTNAARAVWPSGLTNIKKSYPATLRQMATFFCPVSEPLFTIMSAKRKASAQELNERSKSAKNSSVERSEDSSASAAVERVVISKEVDSVVVPCSEPLPEILKNHIDGSNSPAVVAKPTVKPLSAVAARRIARETAEAEKVSTIEPIEAEVVEGIVMEVEEENTQYDSAPSIISDESDSGLKIARSTRQRPRKRKKTKVQVPDPIDHGVVSNFEATAENTVPFEMNNEKYLAIGLKNNESIVFDGKALIAPFRGAVSIMGASLVASDSPGNLTFFPVFSLRTHALLRITPVDSSQSIYRSGGIVDRLDEESLSLLAKMSNDDSLQSIFIVRSLDFCGLDDIDGIFTLTKGLFKPKHPSPGELLDHISGFSPVFNTQPGLRAIEIPDSWNRNINAIIDDAESSKKNPVSVVCGAKDVGKSTFVRYFVNCLLNKHQKIAYLETDIGQSEFSPYGMITLHVLDSPLLGPPYTHQHLTPKRSHFFGAITPRDNPSHYLRCIHQLIDTWRLENSNAADTDQLPLVINTQGWIKGLGYDLMLDIIRDPVVTDIFALQSPQPFPPTFENDVTLTGEPLKQIQREVELRYVESVQKLVPVAKFVAYDLRVMSMVSYLYQNMAQFGKANELWWNFQSCLVERVPWSLDWRTGLNGIWVLWDDIKLSQLLYSLNGSLVALISDDVARERPTPAQGTGDIVPPTYFPPSVYPPPNPDTSFCLGFALVRAIDPSKHAFLFLTPLPAAKLKKVTGMVKGDIELPLCCMLDRQQTGGGGVARQPWRKVPYLTERVVEGLGGNAMQIRRVNRRVRK